MIKVVSLFLGMLLNAITSSQQVDVVQVDHVSQLTNLVQQKDFRYQGAFRVPNGEFGESRFDYGGTALAYNPASDSLFLVGHDWDQMVAEISIPKVINSDQIEDLKIATVLQGFYDISDGTISSVDDGNVKVGGLFVYGNQLLGAAYSYYDADSSQRKSHFSSSLDLSRTEDVSSIFEIGKLGAGFVSGYMSKVPTSFQEKLAAPLIVGQCCLAIIGRTSSGPAAFLVDPKDFSVEASADVKPLVYYPLATPLGKWGESNPFFNGSTSITGIIFPENKNSLLFFGRHGIGPFCYGTGEECSDPTDNSKGTHSYPYSYQVWAYDINDLIEVRNGIVEPWSVRPYGLWNFDLPFSDDQKRIGGVAYDSKSGRIFISQKSGDGNKPLIHVFTLD